MTDIEHLRDLHDSFAPGTVAAVVACVEKMPDTWMDGCVQHHRDDVYAAARALVDVWRALPELLDKLEDSVPKSWDGLMMLLDEAYPDDIFPTQDDRPDRDCGPRIVSLVRHLDEARQELAARDAGDGDGEHVPSR